MNTLSFFFAEAAPAMETLMQLHSKTTRLWKTLNFIGVVLSVGAPGRGAFGLPLFLFQVVGFRLGRNEDKVEAQSKSETTRFLANSFGLWKLWQLDRLFLGVN